MIGVSCRYICFAYGNCIYSLHIICEWVYKRHFCCVLIEWSNASSSFYLLIIILPWWYRFLFSCIWAHFSMTSLFFFLKIRKMKYYSRSLFYFGLNLLLYVWLDAASYCTNCIWIDTNWKEEKKCSRQFKINIHLLTPVGHRQFLKLPHHV